MTLSTALLCGASHNYDINRQADLSSLNINTRRYKAGHTLRKQGPRKRYRPAQSFWLATHFPENSILSVCFVGLATYAPRKSISASLIPHDSAYPRHWDWEVGQMLAARYSKGTTAISGGLCVKEFYARSIGHFVVQGNATEDQLLQHAALRL